MKKDVWELGAFSLIAYHDASGRTHWLSCIMPELEASGIREPIVQAEELFIRELNGMEDNPTIERR